MSASRNALGLNRTPSPPPRRAHANPVAAEALEERRLFFVVPGLSTDGVLDVSPGTPYSNNVPLGNEIVISCSGRSGQVTVTINGEAFGPWPTRDVRSIDVYAGRGDDLVNIADNSPLNDNWLWGPRTTIDGGDGNDILFGSGGADVIHGGDGNDVISGRGGSDTLDGWAGADELTGGPGYDTVTYESRSAPLVITIDGVADDGEAGENDNVNLSVEKVLGGSGDDFISSPATEGTTNNFLGNGGNDTLLGGGGRDTLVGGSDDDVLEGGEGDDDLQGQWNNDTLRGGGGNDRLEGGRGSDTLDGGAGDDRVWGWYEHGAWSIDHADTLDGGDGNDSLWAGSGDDTVRGGAGRDSLFGEAGNDSLDGGAGNDTLDGGEDADRLVGGADEDTADYSGRLEDLSISLDGVANDGAVGVGFLPFDPFTGRAVLDPGEQDNLKSDIENIHGGAGNDRITAPANDSYTNVFYGGPGNDTLDGGGGTDYLLGEDGDDIFYSRDNRVDHLYGNAGNDRARVDALDGLDSVESTFEWLLFP